MNIFLFFFLVKMQKYYYQILDFWQKYNDDKKKRKKTKVIELVKAWTKQIIIGKQRPQLNHTAAQHKKKGHN